MERSLPIKNRILFFKQAFKNIKQIGSVVPSSRFLVERMIKNIDFSKDVHIIELGAGNGVFTKRILKHMSPNSKLVAYEIHEPFLENLNKIDDERLLVKSEPLDQLHENGIGHFDVVLSCLPLANMDKGFKTTLLSEIQSVTKENGLFLQYQYSLTDYSFIRDFFGNCKTEYFMVNIPPAFIYKAITNQNKQAN